jgi:hypothetical protein
MRNESGLCLPRSNNENYGESWTKLFFFKRLRTGGLSDFVLSWSMVLVEAPPTPIGNIDKNAYDATRLNLSCSANRH